MKATDPFFTIQQVSRQCGVPKSTLRFWEKEFIDLLVPVRSHGGQRRYSAGHLARIQRIKQLRDEGMSLQAVKEAIYMELSGNSADSTAKAEIIAERVASLVKMEVRRALTEALTP